MLKSLQYILISLIIGLVTISCGFTSTDKEQIYEAALRYYIQTWDPKPDTIILSIDTEGIEKKLIQQLKDFDYRIISTINYIKPDTYKADLEYPTQLSLGRIRHRGFKKVVIQLSSISPPYSFYSVEYTLKKTNGNWVVIKLSEEIMS